MKKLVCVGWCLLAALAVALCAPRHIAPAQAAPAQTPAKLRHVRLMLPWLPQSQFAGVIMARSKGFFVEQGLDVRFVWGQPGERPLRGLESGAADFAGGWLSSAMALRGEGVPLVNVLQLHQRSALLLVTRSNVPTLKSLNNKIVQAWGGEFKVEFELLLKRNQIKPAKVLPLSSLTPFLEGLVDGCMAMEFSEYLFMQERGLRSTEMNAFAFADHGVNFPGEGLYTHADTFAQEPELVQAMKTAVLKGWRYAIENEDETVITVMKYSEEKQHRINTTHQRQQLRVIGDLISCRVAGVKLPFEAWGHLEEAAFTHVRELLASEGYPMEGVRYETFFVGR